MDRVLAAGRVLDPDRVVKKFAGYVVIDLADGAAEFDAWLNPRLLAAVCRDRATRRERPGLGLDVDDAGGAQAVLRRQSPRDQRCGMATASRRLAEALIPRQLNPFRRYCKFAWCRGRGSAQQSCVTPGAWSQQLVPNG